MKLFATSRLVWLSVDRKDGLMGTFDTVQINGRRYQTKALGKGMGCVHVGDTVKPVYASKTHEEYTLSPIHSYVVSPVDFSFEACEEETGYTVSVFVENSRIVGLGEHSSNRFDYYGTSIGATTWTPTIAENYSWTRRNKRRG